MEDAMELEPDIELQGAGARGAPDARRACMLWAKG
jgi:hypothetical protein